MDSVPFESWKLSYEASKDTCRGITFERFVFLLQDFDTKPIIVDGDVRGAVLVRGPEIHTCVPMGSPWISKKIVRDIIRPIMQAYGFVVTYALSWDKVGQRLATAVGFKPVSVEFGGMAILYRMERESCPQLFQ